MPSSKSSSGTYGLLGKAQHLSKLDHRSAYKGLAKSDEDWTQIVNMSERRRIQNRIAQRTYRQKVKDRVRGLEQKDSGAMTFIHLFPSSVEQPDIRTERESEPSRQRKRASSSPKSEARKHLSPSPTPSNQSWSPSPCLTCSELDALSSSTPGPTSPPSSSELSMSRFSLTDNTWPVFTPDIQPTLSLNMMSNEVVKPEFLIRDFDFMQPPLYNWGGPSDMQSAQAEQDCIQWLTGPSPYQLPSRNTDYGWDNYTW